jgi:glycosyltransferase involved in cell wall biosynthesis
LKLVEMYRKASCLLLPLATASANCALVEAAACGLPIVATDLPAVREYTRPEFSRLVEGRDPRNYVTAMLHFIRHDTPAARQSAREFAETYLAWPKLVAKLETTYRRLFDEKSALKSAA